MQRRPAGDRLWAGLGLWLVLIGAIGRPAAAQEHVPANECCLVLLQPVGARSLAMGRALTAFGSPEAVFANPAGLAVLDTSRILLHHAPGVEQRTNTLSVLMAPRVVGTLGLSYKLVDWTPTDLTGDEPGGPVVGQVTTREHNLVASFATAVHSGLNAGLSYKLYQLRFTCRGECVDPSLTATTHAVDLGLRYRPGWYPRLQVGAALTDLGFPLQVINREQSDILPTRLRLGAAHEVLHYAVADTTLKLWVAGELEYSWRDPEKSVPSVGLELSARGALFLWAGYRGGSGEVRGPSAGVGLRYKRYGVAVGRAFSPSPVLPDLEPTQVTIGVRL